MELDEAKTIPMTMVLAALGHEPVRALKGGEELAYRSPFRNEAEAQFFVNVGKNLWHDRGAASGGDLPDLVMKLLETDFPGAMTFLDTLVKRPDFDFQPVSPAASERGSVAERTLAISEIKPFTASAALRQYVTVERKIAQGVAERFLREVHFYPEGGSKKWFAAGFINRSGGYALRNAYFKGNVGRQDLSFVAGKTAGTNVAVFEGFMDFLTCLTAFHLDVPSTDVLVLNGYPQASAAAQFIREKGYESARTWLHNDPDGKDALAHVIEETDCRVEPQNHRFLGFQDPNACFLATGKIF